MVHYHYMGSQVKRYRKKRGLTIARLAEAVGMSPNFIGAIERGLKKPSLETMARIAVVLDVEMDTLVIHPLDRVTPLPFLPQQLVKARYLLEQAAMLADITYPGEDPAPSLPN